MGEWRDEDGTRAAPEQDVFVLR
ncbi:hypothetical protein TNCV_3005971, partial [Trichonephila clavipes]